MSITIATTLMAGVATLAAFSFLVKENPFYRFFEHLFIGIAAGLGTVLSIKNFLWPNILKPMFGFTVITFPDGSVSEPYNSLLLLYLIPIALGLLYYTISSARYSWLAKVVIGLSLGASGGLAFKAFFNEMLPQIEGSFKPLLVWDAEGFSWQHSVSNTVFVVTLLTVMYYFFFSFREEGKVAGKARTTGRWLMMVCFGSFFGCTVMARMALLVERLQFLYNDWWPTVVGVLFHLGGTHGAS